MTKNNSLSDIAKNLKEIAYDMSILIVEDDQVLQKQIKLFLSKFFKHIDVANNGKEALELYAKNSYSLIFTDLTMPVMGGKELIENIIKIDESQHIMVLSAHQESQKLIDLINIGIDGYLLKPIDSLSMLKQINKVCQYIYNQAMLEHLNIMLEESNSELSKKNAKLEATLKELDRAKKTIDTLTTEASSVKVVQNTNQTSVVIMPNKKMSAAEFLSSYPLELDSINEELEELEGNFYTLLSMAEKACDHSLLMELTKMLRSFAREIEMVPQFGAVAHGILELATAFGTLQDHSKIPMLLPMLGSLFDNLEKWRKGIFLYQDAQDIHYMDNSLISDAQSLQAFLNTSESSSDSELELF